MIIKSKQASEFPWSKLRTACIYIILEFHFFVLIFSNLQCWPKQVVSFPNFLFFLKKPKWKDKWTFWIRQITFILLFCFNKWSSSRKSLMDHFVFRESNNQMKRIPQNKCKKRRNGANLYLPILQ